MKSATPKQYVTRQLVLEAMMDGRSKLHVFVHVRPDGTISTGEAVEILPDGSERERVILCYAQDLKRVGPTLRKMARAHRRATRDPETVAMIDGEFWLRELRKRVDPGCLFPHARPGIQC